MTQFERPQLHELLRARPGDPIPWDPVPPWLLIHELLEPNVMKELVAVQLEAQTLILNAQAELAGKQAEILRAELRR